MNLLSIIELNGEWTKVIVSLIASIPATIAAVYAARGAKSSKQVNDAVNHTHETGKKRILDQVGDIADDVKDVKRDTTDLMEWRRSYAASPWADGDGVHEWLKSFQEIEDKVEGLCEGCPAKSLPTPKNPPKTD